MPPAPKSNNKAPKEPVAAPVVPDEDSTATKSATSSSTKPDKVVYDADQAKIKSEIDALQLKFNAVKDKIGAAGKDGPGAERRKVLKAELDGIRDQQANGKASRGKTLDQLKALQENIAKKTKDLQAAKAKNPYKSIAEVDAFVKKLEKQIDSGTMKLADEKRALQEITQAKRARKAVEAFAKDQTAIDEDRARADELRKQLDDPESKAASERFDAIKAELDELKKEGDEAFANRNKLFDERNALKAQLDDLYAQKKESAQNYKDANDRYWAKINEDRAKRAERYRAQKAAEDEEKRKLRAETLLEEARSPAFQDKIEDCQTLIDWFSAKVSGGVVADLPTPTLSKDQVAAVPKLELRQVEEDSGLVARKKKGQEEESYFVGGKGKKKGPRSPAGSGAQTSSTSGSQLNIPLGLLTSLLEMSIPAPGSTADAPRVIEDLKTKKAWFEANQARVTAENIAKAEREVERLNSGNATKAAPNGTATPSDDNNGEHPPETIPTPTKADENPVAPVGVQTETTENVTEAETEL